MNQALALVSPKGQGCFPPQAQLAQRLVLYRGELYRVPTCYRLLRIKAGAAYVTQAGQDHLLHVGQQLRLSRTADVALVSGVGAEPVILELFDITVGFADAPTAQPIKEHLMVKTYD